MEIEQYIIDEHHLIINGSVLSYYAFRDNKKYVLVRLNCPIFPSHQIVDGFRGEMIIT